MNLNLKLHPAEAVLPMYIGMSFNTVYPKKGYRNKGTINYFQPEQSDSAHTFIFSQVWATLYIYSYYFKCVYQKDSSPLRVPDKSIRVTW